MTCPLDILIVDDEPLAIDRLRMLLSGVDGVAVVGTATTGAAALTAAERHAPDLCLLDIAIPDINGIDIARALARSARPPMVIFVTAFDSFAVAAFDIDAIDYLVKPVDSARLGRAIDRARRHVPAAPVAHPRAHLGEFWVSERDGLRRIAACQIDRICAERDYMRLYSGSRSWLINDSLSHLEQQLDPAEFVRLHRGAIVNRRFVTGMRRDENGWVATLGDGNEQRVSRSYSDNLRTLRGCS